MIYIVFDYGWCFKTGSSGISNRSQVLNGGHKVSSRTTNKSRRISVFSSPSQCSLLINSSTPDEASNDSSITHIFSFIFLFVHNSSPDEANMFYLCKFLSFFYVLIPVTYLNVYMILNFNLFNLL